MSSTHDVGSNPTNPPSIASNSALSPPNPTTVSTNPARAPCHHELALKALNTDLDAMRHLITCKICDRFLYEPYALSCGHTYCYSCLSQWLGSNAKMTCPDCRTVIRQQPTPSYLIRELVLVFVGRNELLPDGETAEEHNKLVREEAEIVARDKANTSERTGGLFKGRFHRRKFAGMGPLHDPGDGVDRCPGCHWELEDGHCNQCGFEVDDLDENFSLDESFSGTDISGEDVDQELDEMDDHDVFVAHNGPDDWGHRADEYWDAGLSAGSPLARHTLRFERPAGAGARRHSIDLVDDEESSDGDLSENDYDLDDTFINDGTVVEEDEESSDGFESDVTAGRNVAPPATRRYGRARRTPVVISDEEDEGEDVTNRGNAGLSRRGDPSPMRPIVVPNEELEDENVQTAPSTSHVSGEESDSEDEGPVVRGSQRNKRPNVTVRSRRAVTVSSDGEEEESDHDGRSEQAGYGGFSPIDDGLGHGAGERADYDSFYDHEDDEDENEAAGFAAPMFDPYEEDPALEDEYDEESDDGWGTARTTTGRNSDGRTSRQPRLAPGPPLPSSSRLGRLQQRRPRHTSPRRRPVPAASPTTALRPAQSLPQLGNTRSRPDQVYTRALPANSSTNSNDSTATATRSRTGPAPNHPFQLDNILARLRDPNRTNDTYTPASGSTYNRRTLEAWNYPFHRNSYAAPTASASTGDLRQQRPAAMPASINNLRNPPAAPSASTGNLHSRGGVTAQTGSSRSHRATVGTSADGRRRRVLSVESDD